MKNCRFSSALEPYMAKNTEINWQDDIPSCQIANFTTSMAANQYYFDNHEWAKGYFEACHRDFLFQECWRTAMGTWDDKIVVDIGCGPGNLYASLGGSPKLIIGVDISRNSLQMAAKIGYTPVLADAQNLPFQDGFADIVTINASIHHCEDMAQVLREAGRLVRPGGLLITDHDPQRTAWNWTGLAMMLYKIRVPIYRLLSGGKFMSPAEHDAMIACETHHKPGDGVTPQLYYQTLTPLDFDVKVYPHNHTVGGGVLQGNYGRADKKYRWGQWLSRINPNSPEAALSLMCVAKRHSKDGN